MHTPAQRDAIERVSTLLKSRDDVEALWLAGSLGAGEGDEWSDIDFLVLTAPEKIAAMPAGLKAAMAAEFQPVFVNDIFGRVLNFIAPDWTRIDLSLVTPPELARFDEAVLKPLFNKGAHAPPVHAKQNYTPAPASIEKLSAEFLRVLGLSPVALNRGEFDVWLNGLDLLRKMTIDLMLEENAVPPDKRGGALKRNPFLTQEQRAQLAQVPAAGPDRNTLIAAHEAIARIFLPRAKALCTRIGAVWPSAFEDATRERLKAAAGMEI